MAKLTAKTRAKIPTGKFALPGRRFPVHDKQHAATAKSYASRMVKRGQLTAGQKSRIDARANAVLGRTGKAIGGKVFNDWDLTDQTAAKRAQEFYAAPSRQGLYSGRGGVNVGGGTLGVGSYGLPATGRALSPGGGQPTTPRGTPTPLARTGSAGAPSIQRRVAAATPQDERVGRAFGYRKGGTVKRMKLAGGGMGDSGRTRAKMKKDRMKLAYGGVATPTAYSGDKPAKRLKGNADYGGFARFDGDGC